MLKSAFTLALVGMIAVPISATAADVVRREDLPAQVSEFTGGFLADICTFECPAGGSAKVAVDTLFKADGTSSPLDPLFDIYFDTTAAVIASGGDENTCTVAPICGFDCAATTFNCTQGGWYTLVL